LLFEERISRVWPNVWSGMPDQIAFVMRGDGTLC
jgi:hypothetical protein